MELLVLGTTHNHILDEQIHPTLTTQYLMDNTQQNPHTHTNHQTHIMAHQNHIMDQQHHPTLTTQYLMDHIQQNHHTLTNPIIQDSIP